MGTQTVENPKPFKEQEPFLWDNKRYYTYASGVGSGKTAVGLMRAALNVDYWNPGYMGAIVAPTSTMIKNAIFPLMREFGIRDKWEYKGPQAEEPGFHAPNGARILILSADNKRTIERLAGLNLAWFWVDEARDVPERALQILIQRLRKGEYKNGFLTSTPRKNHLEDFALDGVDEPYDYGDAMVFEGDDRLAITGVTPHSNPYVTEEDIKAIKDAHPTALMEQEVQGRFIEVGGGIFKRDMIDFIRPEDINPDWQLNYLLGVDPATKAENAEQSDSDYWAATLCAVHRRQQQLFVVDAKRTRGMTLKQGVRWVSDIASQVNNPTLAVESNQSQRWLRQELADQGFSTLNVQSQRDKQERLIDLSIPIENSVVKFVNHEIDENIGYDPRWQNMIQELLAFPEGSHDDLIDSLHLCVDNAQLSSNTVLSANQYEE